MSTNGRLTARVFVIVLAFSLFTTVVQAGGWGHGPNIRGWHPFYKPIPEKPLDGLKQGVQDLGPIIARPFEQIGQSIKDPWGWQKRTERWKNEGLAAAEKAKHDFLDVLVRETHFIVGVLSGVLLTGFAAYFFRRRDQKPKSKRKLVQAQ